MSKLNQIIKKIIIVTIAISLSACGLFKTVSKDEALDDMKWSYAADAITLQIESTKDLNRWDGQPHSLLMVLTQFEDPSAFEPYTKSPSKLSSLLMSEEPPAGLLNTQRYYIEPDTSRTISMARVDKAKYIGIALGYQHLDPRRSVRIYQIGVDMDYSGLILREYVAEPQPLRLELLLGAESIFDSLSTRQDKIKPVQPKAGPWISDTNNTVDTTESKRQ